MDAFGTIALIAMVGFGGYKLVQFINLIEDDKEERRENERKEAEFQELMRKYRERRLQEAEEQKKMESSPWYIAQKQREQAEARRRREEAARRAEEQKRIEEAKRRKELKDKFHYISLGGYKAAYRYDYYPKNRYPYVDDEQESERRAVWSFKDGSSSIGVRIVSDFLEGNYTREQMKNLVFCVIPASTYMKNERRYRTLCDEISSKYPVVNGFEYISICSDRENSREQKNANTIGNLSFSGYVYGKDVILFDDITTRGTSFVQAAQALKAKGARSVYGLFLGKTVSSL